MSPPLRLRRHTRESNDPALDAFVLCAYDNSHEEGGYTLEEITASLYAQPSVSPPAPFSNPT